MAAEHPRKLFKIGEVMEWTGLSRQTIHNYTMLGLIAEVRRTPSGHRLYGEDVFEILKRITEWKKTHTLREIRGMLDAGAATASGGAAGSGEGKIE